MSQRIVGGDGNNLGEQARVRLLSRRDFLVGGAGAGLFVLGLGGLGPGGTKAEASPLDLELFAQGYPRAFFFRQPESDAASGQLTYEEWESRYLPLNGIVGKVLNEAHYYADKNNLTFFLRYKNQNPSKMVLLHYNGTGRRATDEATTRFFSGHWLYYRGTRLTQPISSRTQKVLHVRDTTVFKMQRYRSGLPDDIAIARVDAHGRPRWETAEHVRLERIDPGAKTITVRRHFYGTTARTFPKGSYLAAHVSTGPYRFNNAPENNIPLWSYNFSTECPRDGQGRNCAEALAEYLGEKLGPTGELSSFDGIVFDVFSWVIRFGDPIQDIDVNTDGKADRGIVGGQNVVSKGALAFVQTLREQLGPDKLILADGHIPRESQRGFGHLNGIESEGYPDKYDFKLDHLSRGENIFSYWKEHSPSPSFNYANFRYKQRKPERWRNTFIEPNLSEDHSYKKLRLVLASALFTDSAFTYAAPWNPPEVPWREGGVNAWVFDELWRGVDQQPNWLGQPLGPAVHLATRKADDPTQENLDLFEGQGVNWPDAFIGRFEGEGVSFSREGTQEAPMMVIKSTSLSRPPAMSFTLPGIDVTGRDLFVSLRLRAEPLEDFPASVPRRVDVGAVPEGEGLRPANQEFTWAGAQPFDASLYYQDVGPGTVHLRFEVEGENPVYFESIAAHSAADGRYREYENGVVFANPSTRSYTFEVETLFPGVTLKRIDGSERQDPATNDGTVVGRQLTLSARNALFVVRSET